MLGFFILILIGILPAISLGIFVRVLGRRLSWAAVIFFTIAYLVVLSYFYRAAGVTEPHVIVGATAYFAGWVLKVIAGPVRVSTSDKSASSP